MRKLVYKYTFILGLLLLGILLSSLKPDPRNEFTKTIKKEFDISPNGKTTILNQYGKIDVKTWDKNRVRIEIMITVRTGNEDSAQKIFDRINIQFSNQQDAVKAATSILPEKTNWFVWGTVSTDYSITYEVFVPRNNQLEITNKNGDVYVDEMGGKVDISLKYGNFRLDGLKDNSKLSLAYANGTVVKAKDLNTDIRYARLNLKEADNVDISSSYSKISFGTAQSIKSTSKYDTYNVAEVNNFTNTGKYDNIEINRGGNVQISSKFSDIFIEEVFETISLDLLHTEASVGKLSKDFSKVNLIGSHSDFRLNVERGAQYLMDASADYAGIKYPRVLILTYEKEKSTFHEVKGHVGNNSTASVIKARLDYGGLNVRQD